MDSNVEMESVVTGVQIKKSTNILLNIFFIILAILCMYPLVLVLMVSLTDEISIPTYGYSIIPKEFSLSAYEYIFGNFGAIGKAYLVTIGCTVFGGILGLLIMAMYAYPLARDDFKQKSLFNLIAVITMLFSGGLIPTYMVYVRLLGLKDNYLAIILPSLFSAFYVMIIRTFYRTNVPKSLIEAAQIDGSSEYYTFFKIVLPLAKPALATVMLFSMLVYWNDWYYPLLYITKSDHYNLQYLLYNMQKKVDSIVAASGRGGAVDLSNIPTETARMAMAIVAIGPIILAYPFFQRYFQKGITLGATKE
ncbi:MAG: carbohydrate ABC transporter permease [Cellulosilyticum sp.]|nr:carbohydrate ABC transporter permease [Cellulosilyticum sp.]